MDSGLQLYPLPKVPIRSPPPPNLLTELAVKFVTYRLPSTSNPIPVVDPPSFVFKVRKNEPSLPNSLTCPLLMPTKIEDGPLMLTEVFPTALFPALSFACTDTANVPPSR